VENKSRPILGFITDTTGFFRGRTTLFPLPSANPNVAQNGRIIALNPDSKIKNAAAKTVDAL
jgi:hypothetical protein